MKSIAALFAVFWFTLPSHANVIDVSGLESWDLMGDPDNPVFNIDSAPGGKFGVILGFSFDFRVQTIGDSWLSDLHVNFEITDGWFHDPFWPEPFALAPGMNYGGTERFTGYFQTDVHLHPEGKFNLSFYESYDDQPDAPDAILLEGSTITVDWFIPSPGTGAVFGLWGMIACRRRR